MKDVMMKIYLPLFNKVKLSAMLTIKTTARKKSLVFFLQTSAGCQLLLRGLVLPWRKDSDLLQSQGKLYY